MGVFFNKAYVFCSIGYVQEPGGLSAAFVCVLALLGGVVRAGLPGVFLCASPFLWLFCPTSFLSCLRAGVAFFSFVVFPLIPRCSHPRCLELSLLSGPGYPGFWRSAFSPAPPPFPCPHPVLFLFFPQFFLCSCPRFLRLPAFSGRGGVWPWRSAFPFASSPPFLAPCSPVVFGIGARRFPPPLFFILFFSVLSCCLGFFPLALAPPPLTRAIPGMARSKRRHQGRLDCMRCTHTEHTSPPSPSRGTSSGVPAGPKPLRGAVFP